MLPYIIFAISLLGSFIKARAAPSVRVINLQNFTDDTGNQTPRQFTYKDFAGNYTRFMELSRTGHLCPNTVQIGSNGNNISSQLVQLSLDAFCLNGYNCTTASTLTLEYKENFSKKTLTDVFQMSSASKGVEGILRRILLDLNAFYYGIVEETAPCVKTNILQHSALVFTSNRDAFATGLQLSGHGYPKFIFWRDAQKTCLFSGSWVEGQFHKGSSQDDNHTQTDVHPTPEITEDVDISDSPAPSSTFESVFSMTPSASESASPSLTMPIPSMSFSEYPSITSAPSSTSESDFSMTPSVSESPSPSQTMLIPSMSISEHPSITPAISSSPFSSEAMDFTSPSATPPGVTVTPSVTGSLIVLPLSSPSFPLPMPLPTMEIIVDGPTPEYTVKLTVTPSPVLSESFSPSPAISTTLIMTPSAPLESPSVAETFTSTPSFSAPVESEAPSPSISFMTFAETPSFTLPEESETPSSSVDFTTSEPIPSTSVVSTPRPTSTNAATVTPTPNQSHVTPISFPSSEFTEEPEETSTFSALPTFPPSEGSLPPSLAPTDAKESPEVVIGATEMPVPSSSDVNPSQQPVAPVTPKDKFSASPTFDIEEEIVSPELSPPAEIESPTASPSSSSSLTPSPSASASEDDNSGSACFPSDALVTLATGERVKMAALKVGDVVEIADNMSSTIIGFTHSSHHVQSTFVKLTTEDGQSLHISPGHYVYSSRGIVAGRHVEENDFLQLGNRTMARVVRKEHVVRWGLFNPQTRHGDIVVDGFHVSTYTCAVEPTAAHALLAPIRAIGTWGARVVQYIAADHLVVAAARAVLGSY